MRKGVSQTLRSMEFSGKSVDEAIFKGLDEMGLSIDEVTIEIVDEGGKRLFGMANKQAVVRLTERDQEEIEAALAYEEEQRRQEQQKRQIRSQSPEQRPRNHGRGRGGAQRERGQKKPRPAQPEMVEKDWGEPIDGGKEAEFLAQLLEKMGMEEASFLCYQADDSLVMRISGDKTGILIGRRGETLNALQYLCSLVANKEDKPYRRVIVDSNNYRAKREVTLQRLAKSKADYVKKSGRTVSLEPMNPYERRVLHSTLQDNAYVTTHSEGEEPNRHVVITPKND